MHKRNAIIVGAGAAGLTAAYYLLKLTDVRPIVLEAENFIGGRKFFADEFEVSMLREILREDIPTREVPTKIFCRGKIFDWPVAVDWSSFKSFGLIEGLMMGASFLRTKFFPRDELTVEDRLINRVGRRFYETVLRNCKPAMPAEDEKFFCTEPELNQLLEKFSDEIKTLGGEVLTNSRVQNFTVTDDKIRAAQVESAAGMLTFPADYFLTSVPIVDIHVLTIGFRSKKISDAPRRIYIAEPDKNLSRVKFLNDKICAEFFTDDDDFSARAIDEIVATGLVDAREIEIVGVEKIPANFFGKFTGAKNFHAVTMQNSEAVAKSIAGKETKR